MNISCAPVIRIPKIMITSMIAITQPHQCGSTPFLIFNCSPELNWVYDNKIIAFLIDLKF